MRENERRGRFRKKCDSCARKKPTHKRFVMSDVPHMMLVHLCNFCTKLYSI